MKIRKTICGLLLVYLTFLGIFAGRVNVYADQKQALSATVTLLKQEKDCVVQVEAKNTGADFTGKVRLVFSGTDNSSGCAFEQCLTLPQNGKKQYTMTIPYADVSQTRGNGIVAFVDEKGNVVAKEAFASIFGKEKRGIGVGVLSDHYDALGWMSMSGQTYYLHGKDQNVYLTQMDADTLQAQLDELYFLVIDSYDVSSLGKEKIKAIEKWVKNGGWLLIGTGERGKDTLGGFDSSFMEVSCKSVSKVGEENDASKEMQQMGSYSGFTGIDFSQMPVAKLQRNNTNASESEAYPGWVYACGDGAVGVCAISFGEKEAAAYDEAAVLENKKKLEAHSQLQQWPVQIKLVPINAPYFDDADLLIAADCTAYAYANFHQDFIKGKITLIGCPKLDSADYSEKLTEIIRQNNIKSVTIVRMEVPCCGGIQNAAINAMKASGKFLPWQVYTISTDGRILA